MVEILKQLYSHMCCEMLSFLNIVIVLWFLLRVVRYTAETEMFALRKPVLIRDNFKRKHIGKRHPAYLPLIWQIKWERERQNLNSGSKRPLNATILSGETEQFIKTAG